MVTDAFIPNKVLVQGFPDGTQEFVLQLYLQSLSQGIQCTEVVLHGKLAVATFAGALGTFLIPTQHLQSCLHRDLYHTHSLPLPVNVV